MLITGGSSGIGLSIAKRVVSQGARVILAARDHEKLQRAREEILRDPLSGPDAVTTVSVDLTQSLEAVEAALHAAG